MNIDEFMSDWREMFCGQHNAGTLHKIKATVEDLSKVLKPEDSLLDVGCNIGQLYAELNHKNYSGIDINPEYVASARARFPDVSFEVMDLFNLSGHWDVIWCSRVMPHLPNYEQAIKKLISCSKICVVTVPITEDSVRIEDPESSTKHYYRTFSEKTVRFEACEIIPHKPYSTVIYGRQV